jgi:hypothetical protein
MSHSHFEDICIIGMSFLSANKVGLHAFCGDNIFYLNFDEEFEEKGMNLRRKKKWKLDHPIRSLVSIVRKLPLSLNMALMNSK